MHLGKLFLNEELQYLRDTWKAKHMRFTTGITEDMLKIIYNLQRQ